MAFNSLLLLCVRDGPLVSMFFYLFPRISAVSQDFFGPLAMIITCVFFYCLKHFLSLREICLTDTHLRFQIKWTTFFLSVWRICTYFTEKNAISIWRTRMEQSILYSHICKNVKLIYWSLHWCIGQRSRRRFWECLCTLKTQFYIGTMLILYGTSFWLVRSSSTS